MAATLDEYIISQVCVLINGAWDPKSGEVWGCSNGSIVHSTPSSTHHGAGNIIGTNTPNDPFIFSWGTDCWSYTQTGTTHGNTTLDGLTSTGGVFSVGAVWLLSAADITAGTAVSSVTSGTALVMGAAASGSNTETVTFYPQGCSNGLLHYNDGSVYPLADSIRYGLQNYFSPRL